MLLITYPRHCQNEYEWVFTVVFNEFLGVPIKLTPKGTKNVSIISDKKLILPDIFFALVRDNWLNMSTLPVGPLAQWDLSLEGISCRVTNEKLPILYGTAGYVEDEDSIYINADLFGGIFYMLSRYEEVVIQDRDQHNRFHFKNSTAFREGFLLRPLVNEYIEVLWFFLKKISPKLERRAYRKFRIRVTCDVDVPYSPYDSFPRFIRELGGDLLYRRNPKLFLKNITNRVIYIFNKCLAYKKDPRNTFDWMMDVCDKNGVQCEFYFMTGGTHKYDAYYSIEDPMIRHLLKRIYERGHIIGFHASYNTYLDQEKTKEEFNRLVAVCEEEGVFQEQWGGRQHYLRWQTPDTFRNWENAGLSYDSTLSYAGHAGFRCGICYEYTVYDVKKRKSLKLKERPLILMECSVISDSYMGLGYSDKSLELMKKIKHNCEMFDGDFVFLWHNSFFYNKKDKEFYISLLGKK